MKMKKISTGLQCLAMILFCEWLLYLQYNIIALRFFFVSVVHILLLLTCWIMRTI